MKKPGADAVLHSPKDFAGAGLISPQQVLYHTWQCHLAGQNLYKKQCAALLVRMKGSRAGQQDCASKTAAAGTWAYEKHAGQQEAAASSFAHQVNAASTDQRCPQCLPADLDMLAARIDLQVRRQAAGPPADLLVADGGPLQLLK